MADAENVKSLSGLLNGIAQSRYYGNTEINEELLKSELYPDLPLDEFHALHDKMQGIIKSIVSADMDSNQIEAFLTAQTKKQGGITVEQSAVIAKFWKNHKRKIRESVINQTRWENTLKSLKWRIDVKSQSRYSDQVNNAAAVVEMEIGTNGKQPEFLCVEFNEAKLNEMLKKLSEVEESLAALTQIS
ncbi:PREDICTED: COMM domain-containing protein 1 [Nanorana parkeri]|uniref:COMM domain-containing protein 1 n=1 Tax=Nanorana parkeri TaxID=125878 RepID=UPI0008543894|nr:PREDICTED: COMM domain-containing protein 1 [Nanorana parkeri]